MLSFIAFFVWIILFVFALVVAFGLWLVWRLRLFLTGGRRRGGAHTSAKANDGSASGMGQSPEVRVFTDDEGEYVDFEEVPQDTKEDD